ncbi:uncharacterized protein LOC114268766 [Camellia sinensis]|uniref:uncharacterized protein LOC114268766 n=1 Tax=Camellia sinensis TaxID=4442 RepID=UPI0010362EDC|nr:uncharacterized protein LOC114268766 [Camellia sinensis]
MQALVFLPSQGIHIFELFVGFDIDSLVESQSMVTLIAVLRPWPWMSMMEKLGNRSLWRRPPTVGLLEPWLLLELHLTQIANGTPGSAEMIQRQHNHTQGPSALPWLHKPYWSQRLLCHPLEPPV